MDSNERWQLDLIALFCTLSDAFAQGLWTHVMRLSPNCRPAFSDEEVLTVYLFGLMRQQTSLRTIHQTARSHWAGWFPRLPGYGAFVQRVNHLAPLLPPLVQRLCEGQLQHTTPSHAHLVDSCPIVLAQAPRSTGARVARPWADKGYSASKGSYFYGVKLHLMGRHRAGTLPVPEWAMVAPASEHDLNVLKRSGPPLERAELYADRIYRDQRWQQEQREQHQVVLHAPIKRSVGQAALDAADRLYSRAVSRVRQPIESLFHWINQKTGLQNASRVRSTQGLWVHIFGRLAAALLLMLAANP